MGERVGLESISNENHVCLLVFGWLAVGQSLLLFFLSFPAGPKCGLACGVAI
jgi:hypothetical protein